jgi:hypothetical protein
MIQNITVQNRKATNAGAAAGRSITGRIVFFAALIGLVAPAFAQTIYEAEDATVSGPSIATVYGGYSGTGYADYNNASSDYIEFSLNANPAGTYPIAFRYANGGAGDRPLQLKVNGAIVTSGLSFPVTGNWATWAYTATNNVTFNAGPNTVRITATGSSGANVDHLLVTTTGTSAVSNSPGANIPSAPLRRPISPNQPMLLVHIDTWNYADPQKIIDLIPPDIRPYVVMNVSLSINHNTNKWLTVEYGYETARSWVRTCAENNIWCTIQPSSGGYCHFSNSDISVYEEFFRDYPNFLGFNYTEQFWGFDDIWAGSVSWIDRVAHWADLMKLNQKYGGYLVVSWCGNQWDANINPLALMKRNPAFAAICKQSPQNLIVCEKYTQQSYQSDMESVFLGDYLAGYAGQYGIRYDETGWTDATGSHTNFTMASAGAPILEHVMLTGQTVIDGPELIWAQDIQGLSNGTTPDGYTTRRWGLFSQYQNVTLDIFRKILDGTVRIPGRQEVINRTKVVIVNDVNSGTDQNKYSSPQTLFEGLYRMDGDGNYELNKNFMKSTGRYPTVPTVYNLADSTASNLFTVKVNNSTYSTRWPNIAAKTNEFNSLFPQEYTGNIFAGRIENGWVVYNPFKTALTNGQMASGSIPFKYNTCDRMDLTLSQYSAGVIKEYSNTLSIYLGNYDNFINLGMRTDVIKIYGASSQPTSSWADRASHAASAVTTSWSGGVYTLNVTHNGALDITVHCAGAGTGRLTSYTAAAMTTPAKPLVYAGVHQYEAENFDYKSISGNVTEGVNTGVSNYTAMGYMRFGTSSSARTRDIVTVLTNGTYRLETRYSVLANVNTIDLYVNGAKVATPTFTQTASLSDWAINKQTLTLNAGTNTIEFRANATGASSLYFDNIVVVPSLYNAGMIVQENGSGLNSVEGTIDNAYPGYTGAGYANPTDAIGAGMDWNIYFDPSVTKAFTFRYAGTNAGTATLFINGTNAAANIQFPATGAWTNWDYVTVYAYAAAGPSVVRLQSTTGAGLPDIDYVEVTGGGGGTNLPVLAAVANRTIGVGVTLNITNVATDSDVPAPALTYSLPLAPTNAMINTNSGVLTWRPLVTQGGTTNSFTVRVADRAVPVKNAAQSFTVTVTNLTPPQVTPASFAGGQLALQVSGASGPDYQIQTSTNLADWRAVWTTNSPPMPFVWLNTMTNGSSMNFFRILAGPPF